MCPYLFQSKKMTMSLETNSNRIAAINKHGIYITKGKINQNVFI